MASAVFVVNYAYTGAAIWSAPVSGSIITHLRVPNNKNSPARSIVVAKLFPDEASKVDNQQE